jgi:putative spermidine/putrescine transport system permease protein
MRTRALAGLPFLAFIGLFLVYPTAIVLWRSVTPGGTPGTASLERAISDPYQSSFVNSIQLSLASGLIGAVIGLGLALAIYDLRRPRFLRPLLESWSAVASQLGGVPLAFAFVAAIGTQGVLTKVLRETTGFDLVDHGIGPTGFWGLVSVYLYFQIPLMFLVILPAVGGLKKTWREAAAVLGAPPNRYWRSVALPLLTPSFIGGFLLLFVNAFSAYATAYVLSPSTQIVPLQIRFLLQGNVITGEQDLAYAIVTWTVILLLLAVLVMGLANRRAALWSRQ